MPKKPSVPKIGSGRLGNFVFGSVAIRIGCFAETGYFALRGRTIFPHRAKDVPLFGMGADKFLHPPRDFLHHRLNIVMPIASALHDDGWRDIHLDVTVGQDARVPDDDRCTGEQGKLRGAGRKIRFSVEKMNGHSRDVEMVGDAKVEQERGHLVAFQRFDDFARRAFVWIQKNLFIFANAREEIH